MIGYWFLETKVLVLVVLIATGISGNRVRKYIIIADIRTQREAHMHTFLFLFRFFLIYCFVERQTF